MIKKLNCFLLFLTLIFSFSSLIYAQELPNYKISGTTVTQEENAKTTTFFNADVPIVIPDTKILVLHENMLIGKTVSDDQGHFKLNGLRKGDYLIFAKNETSELSGIASLSLTTTTPKEQEIQLNLTNNNDLDEFFKQKWNENQIARNQNSFYTDYDSMNCFNESESMGSSNAYGCSNTYGSSNIYSNFSGSYGNHWGGYGIGSGSHWGTWLAAGALTAAIVALAVEDDTPPVSPFCPR